MQDYKRTLLLALTAGICTAVQLVAGVPVADSQSGAGAPAANASSRASRPAKDSTSSAGASHSSRPALGTADRGGQSGATRSPGKLVPPPPVIPAMVLPGHASWLPVQLDYLSEAEIVSLHEKLHDSTARARRRWQDHQVRLKEQKGRLELFQGLYKEGVVSRRDLESAQRDLWDLEDKTATIKEELDRFSTDLARMEEHRSRAKPPSSGNKSRSGI